ncbi:hypothetical protein F4560_000086 [Saccharothrix ecbatanensis]|uniref:Uncharacterized protein n=1 Tax=Saccharothrix ecbatanensis TaxID=1105145 RepID=A0A7W9HE84_9PSEU|nr:hypothetical protein [Saccharothrix ecbatanensis]MBB5800318.1 hypothetical protein [Saccharothrix ecbatanensis]
MTAVTEATDAVTDDGADYDTAAGSAGHLPGMWDVLLHNGFRLDSVRWMRAAGRMRSLEGAPVTGDQPGEESEVSVKVYGNGQVGTS